jgi:Domain of unknown function (DUF4412)
MKALQRTLAGLAATLAAAALASASPFEGVADFRVQTSMEKGKSMTGTGRIFVTPSAYRTEWEMTVPDSSRRGKQGPQRMKMTMLGKVANPNVLTMINDENKTYSVWDASKSAKEAGSVSKETYTVERLGAGSVAGFGCDKARLTSSQGDQIEVCVSKELGASGDWIAAVNRSEASGQNWVRVLKEKGIAGFPVRWSMRRKGETEPFTTTELTRLEKKSLPASLFEVPAGYRQTDIAIGGLTPEQEKAMSDARAQMDEALKNMTPEQRKAYEDAMKRYAQPTPRP